MRLEATGEKHGVSATYDPLERKAYRTWVGMRQRCYNPRHKQFADWGGRGIRICERWTSFVAFVQDVGLPPTLSASIDRIDVNGHYEPGNVRWTGQATQNRNQRHTKLSFALAKEIREARAHGVKVAELARKYDLSRSNVYDILNGHKWTNDFPPLRKRRVYRLDLAIATEMRKLYATGVSQERVAAAFGFPRCLIQGVVENKTYQDPNYQHQRRHAPYRYRKSWGDVVRIKG